MCLPQCPIFLFFSNTVDLYIHYNTWLWLAMFHYYFLMKKMYLGESRFFSIKQ